MNIVFIGTVDFSRHCLVEILKNNGKISGIISSENSGFNSDYSDLSDIAEKVGIPFLLTKDINSADTERWIADKKPDIIFCFGWSNLIKKRLLNLPPMGILGVHPALLPENRGRHPIIWSIVLGLKKSGLTFFFMDEGADSGPILSQKSFEISETDNAADVYEKIKRLACFQIKEFLPHLEKNTYKLTLQDNLKVNYLRKRSTKDGIIDWRMPSNGILNLVRALYKPYPGAEIKIKDKNYKVWKVEKSLKDLPVNIEPGKVIEVQENIPCVKTGDGSIKILEIEPEFIFKKGMYL
ncbi:MAG: formyltransferase family protein [Desulforegulaceae bacterium]|nr:formyltransferase family protein [Desulforegulaceae bacterium]